MATSDVLIANAALSAATAGSIQSMNENSLEAKECRKAYRPVVDELLEAHKWSFASTRVALAEITNDRALEWAYAYTLPSGAVPSRISWVSGAGSNAYVPLVGQTLAATGYVTDFDTGYPYQIAGTTLYTNVAGALLDYSDTAVSEERFAPLFTRAVVLELAKRICMPITKNQSRYREMTVEAQTAWDRAVTADLNRSQNSYMTQMPGPLAARD